MCMANRAGLAAVALAASLVAGPADATADEAVLSGVSDMVRELRYEEALARIEILRTAPETTPAVRLRALELAAVAQLGLGRLDDAREAFRLLLTLDPDAELTMPRPSPRVSELFQSVRSSLGDNEPIGGLTTTLSREGPAIVAEASPAGEHTIVRVVFRAERGGRSTEIEGSDGGPPWRAQIPVAGPDDVARLSVVARGFAPSGALAAVSSAVRFDAQGRVVEAAADPDPFRLETDDEREPSSGGGVTSRWWFWGAIGAVVVGGTVTAVVLATSGSDSARSGDLGSFRVTRTAGD